MSYLDCHFSPDQTVYAVAVILGIRTWSMWERSKRVGILLTLWAVIILPPGVVIMIIFLKSISCE